MLVYQFQHRGAFLDMQSPILYLNDLSEATSGIIMVIIPNNQFMNVIFKNNPRSRRLTIRLNSKGDVIVTKPIQISEEKASRFVAENQAWINLQQANLTQVEHLESETWVYLFGKKYHKICEYARNRPVGCFIEHDSFVINPVDPKKTDLVYQEKEIVRFLKHTAQHYILPRTEYLAKKMQLTFAKVTLREQSSRWGSCSSAGNLNFNWRLVHFEPPVIDYVIIHELSHRDHMDHSKSFWNLVQKFDPAYPKHRGVLKRFGAQLH